MLPDFPGAYSQRLCLFGEPFEVRMLKADSADAPVSFDKEDKNEPVIVEVFRAQKQTQPTYVCWRLFSIVVRAILLERSCCVGCWRLTVVLFL